MFPILLDVPVHGLTGVGVAAPPADAVLQHRRPRGFLLLLRLRGYRRRVAHRARPLACVPDPPRVGGTIHGHVRSHERGFTTDKARREIGAGRDDVSRLEITVRKHREHDFERVSPSEALWAHARENPK